MKTSPLLASLLTAWALVACGGGSDSTDTSATPAPAPAPAASTPAAETPAPAPAPTPAADPVDALTAPAFNTAHTDQVRAIDVRDHCPTPGASAMGDLSCLQGPIWGKVVTTDGTTATVTADDCVLNVSTGDRATLENRGAAYQVHTIPFAPITNMAPALTAFTTAFTSDAVIDAETSVATTVGTHRTLAYTANTTAGDKPATLSLKATPLNAQGTSWRVQIKATATEKAGDGTLVNDTYNLTSSTNALTCLATIN